MSIIPTPKQQEFLSNSDDIVLFGGAVGGAKSYALMLDALGLNDPNGPRISHAGYRALIFRKQFNHLQDLIDKSKNIFPQIDKGAVFNASELYWKFSSGAIIRFDYFENITQAEGKLIGKEFSWVGADEVQLYETDEVFRFVQSRLRNPHGWKCYFRCTCNPGRYAWLQKFFRIPNDGTSTRFSIESLMPNGKISKTKVSYIQSKLTDNPYLPENYMERLMLLNENDRKALIEGLWGVYEVTDAQVYKAELDNFFRENRLTTVPYQQGFDTFCAFDLGWSDYTSIVVFQMVGKEYHVIDSYQNNGKVIDHFWDWIKQTNYSNINIILPHDSRQKSLQTGMSMEEQFQKVFQKVIVLPKIDNIEDGITRTKQKFPCIFIDKKNEELMNCLKSYDREYNAKNDMYGRPIHNRASHFVDSFRYMCEFEKPTSYDFSVLSKSNASYSFY